MLSSLKQFEVRRLAIADAKTATMNVYKDERGSLYEPVHCLKCPCSCSLFSVSMVYPKQNVVYGPISHTGEETIFVIRGALLTILVNNRDHSVKEYIDLQPGTVITIPENVIHAMIAVKDDTIIGISRPSYEGPHNCFFLNDPSLDIKWPADVGKLIQNNECSLLQNTRLGMPKVDFLVFGTGMIGNAFIREIEAENLTWIPIRSRLNNIEALRNEISFVHPRISVIVAAGVGTRPNTHWCDDHRLETVDANVTCQIAIAQICKECNIHCTLIGTAGFYHYDDDRTLYNNVGFEDDETPNQICNTYYEMRVLLEKLLHESGLDHTTLNLRALFPMDFTASPSSLLGKLLKFQVIRSIPTSMTILDSLTPLAIEVMKRKETGSINWVNEGRQSNGDVLRAYKQFVDPKFTFREENMECSVSKVAGNSAAYVIPNRLRKIVGKVPSLQESTELMMKKLSASRAATAK